MDELKNFIIKDFERIKNKRKEVSDNNFELMKLIGNLEAYSEILNKIERIVANGKNGNGNRDN